MRFEYRAYDMMGTVLTGASFGENEQEVICRLGDKGLMVVSLKPVKSKERHQNPQRVKVPLAVLSPFTRQMATMIGAGLPILGILESVQRQSKNHRLRTVLQGLNEAVGDGKSFSEALELYPRVFSPIYIAMAKAGEEGGLLPEALDRMANYLEMSLRLRQRVRSAMMYPIIVSVTGIGICLFLITTIIPVFAVIFSEFQYKLPLPTLILINVSTWVRTHYLVVLATTVGLGLCLRYLRRTPLGALFWDRLKLRLPVFGPVANKIAFTRFARTLASMIHSGVPVLNALSIAGNAVGNVELEAAIRRVRELIEKGSTLHEAMATQKKFPDMILEMVAAGEATGKVDELLNQVANHYDLEIDTTLSGLTSLLEPILILFLGIVFGGVVIAMFLPIMRLAQAVQF